MNFSGARLPRRCSFHRAGNNWKIQPYAPCLELNASGSKNGSGRFWNHRMRISIQLIVIASLQTMRSVLDGGKLLSDHRSRAARCYSP